MALLTYRRHRFSPEIIQHAVWLCLRLTLSRCRGTAGGKSGAEHRAVGRFAIDAPLERRGFELPVPSRAKSVSPAEREFRGRGFRSAPPFMANRPRIMAALSLARRGRVSRGLVRHCAARLAQEPRSFSAGVFASLDLRWRPNRFLPISPK